MLPHDYLNYYLTGNFYTEAGDASGTGFFNVYKKEWGFELLKFIDKEKNWEEIVLEVKNNDDDFGFIKKEIAEELGLKEDVRVASGGGDNMMGAIGSGVVEEGIASISLGTSGTIFINSKKPYYDSLGEIASFCSSNNSYLPLLCTMNCTISTELTRDLFSSSLEEINELAKKSKAGSDGIIVIPFFTGERTPNLPNAKASIMNLSIKNYTKENLFRAFMESSIFPLKAGLEKLKETNKIKEIRIIGGGSRSELWCQIISDIMNMEVKTLKVNEGPAFGACLQAYSLCKNIKLKEVVSKNVSIDKTYRANKENVTIYKEVYKNYLKYLEILKPTYQGE